MKRKVTALFLSGVILASSAFYTSADMLSEGQSSSTEKQMEVLNEDSASKENTEETEARGEVQKGNVQEDEAQTGEEQQDPPGSEAEIEGGEQEKSDVSSETTKNDSEKEEIISGGSEGFKETESDEFISGEVQTKAVCNCDADFEDPYLHEWSCDIFKENFFNDCSCGLPGEKVTDHEFSCTAFLRALSVVCSCEVGNVPVMHDECTVIQRMHKEICDCGWEYDSIDAVLETHDEKSVFYQYLMNWADYYNQPQMTYYAPSLVYPGSTSPVIGKITKVSENFEHDREYGFAWAISDKTSLTVTDAVYQEDTWYCLITKNYDDSAIQKYTATYSNVGSYDGRQIDLKIETFQWGQVLTSFNQEADIDNRPSISFNDSGTITLHRIASTKFYYYLIYHDTGERANIKTHLTFSDIDGNQRIWFTNPASNGENAVLSNINQILLSDQTSITCTSGYSSKTKSMRVTEFTSMADASSHDEKDKRQWLMLETNDGTIYNNWLCPDNYDTNYGKCVMCVTCQPIGQYVQPDPEKQVELPDGTWSNERTSLLGGDTVKYRINQKVYPSDYSESTLFQTEDTLDSCLFYKNGSARVLSGTTDVTGWFNVNYKDQRIVFTAKNMSKEYMYNGIEFSFVFEAVVGDEKQLTEHGHGNDDGTWSLMNGGEKGNALVYLGTDLQKRPNATIISGSLSGSVIVTKKIQEKDIIWAHGNPVFRFILEGTDIKGISHTYKDYVEFSEGNYVKEGNYAVLSLEFKNIPTGTYEITEASALRYSLGKILPETDNVSVLNGAARIELGSGSTTARVVFENNKVNFGGYSHSSIINNQIAIEKKTGA